MGGSKTYRLLGRCQLASIGFLGLLFGFFELRVGMKNYILYKTIYNYREYLNDNIVIMLMTGFILLAAIAMMYVSVGKLSRSRGIESLLMALIFMVWALLYKKRIYYHYGLILGIVINTIQNLKLLFFKYSREP